MLLIPLAMANKVVLARLLHPQYFGLYLLFLKICDIAGIFSLLGTKTLTVKLVGIAAGSKEWGKTKGILQSIFKLITISSLIMVLIIWMIRQPLASKVFNSPELSQILIFCFFIIPLQNFLLLTGESFKGLQDLKITSILPVIQQSTYLLCLFVLGISFALNVQKAISTFGACTFLSLVTGLYILRKRTGNWRAEPVKTKSILAQSLPMMVISGTQMFISNMDIYILGIFRTMAEVGIYGVVYSLATTTFFSMNVINQVIPAMIADYGAQKDFKALSYVVRYATTIGAIVSIPVFLVLILFGQNILGGVFGPQYMCGTIALRFLVLGQMVNMLTGSCDYFLQMTGFHIIFMKISLFTGFLNLILNLVLVQHFGIEGVAFASALAMLVQNISSLIFVYLKTGIWTLASFEITLQIIKQMKKRYLMFVSKHP